MTSLLLKCSDSKERRFFSRVKLQKLKKQHKKTQILKIFIEVVPRLPFSFLENTFEF